MLRTEMIDNLLDSYTVRELEALGKRMGLDEYIFVNRNWTHEDMLSLADQLHNILFDPGCSYIEFNKLAEMEQ